MISFSIHNDISDISDIWKNLDASASALINNGNLRYIEYSFYQTFRWNNFLYEIYHGSIRKKIEYIVVNQNQQIIGILPMITDNRRKKGGIIDGKIAGITNFVYPVEKGKADETILAELVGFITQRYAGYRLRLHDIPQDSTFFNALKQSGLSCNLRESYHIPIADFDTHSQYIASLGKHMGQNIRTAYNRLDKDGKRFKLTVFSRNNPPEFRFLAKIWHIYFKRKLNWKKKNVDFVMRTIASFRSLHEVLMGRASKSISCLDDSRLIVLDINGRPAAFLIAYIDGVHAVVPKLAIDNSFGRYSPGIILVLETLKLFRQNGIIDFDLCRGNEKYKQDLGGVNQTIGTFRI